MSQDENDQEADGSIPYGPKQEPWSDQVPKDATVAAPLDNPADMYVQVPPSDVEGDFPSIDYSLFQIPPTGLSDEERDTALASFKNFIEIQHAHFAGFQGNQDQRYVGIYPYLLNMHANNIGDPFSTGRYTLNSKFCERAVLDYFAALWNAPWPHTGDPSVADNRERYWGYVLTMGFTEGNIYGLFNARDYLKGRALLEEPQTKSVIDSYATRGKEVYDRKLSYVDPIVQPEDNPNAYSPVLFFSEDVHYSVQKASRLIELPSFQQVGQQLYPGDCPITENGEWPSDVPSHNYDVDNPLSGSVRIDELTKLVSFFVLRGHPPVIVANLGTTWKGAYDDVPAINDMLEKLGEQHPWLWERNVQYDTDSEGNPKYDVRRGFWLHVDGALGAAYLPFIEMAHKQGLIDRKGPIFDFRNPAVMSLGCSSHKWLGSPWPSGVFITRTKYQLMPPDEAAYFLGTPDTTLGGSRSAFSPMILWDYLSRMSYEDSIQKAIQTEDVTAYLETQLRQLETDLKAKFGDHVDLWIARSYLSLTVRFRQVNETLNWRWSLDTDRLWVPISDTERELRSYSHVFVMHSVDRARVDALIADIREAAKENWHNAFPTVDAPVNQPNPGPPTPITQPTSQSNVLNTVPLSGRGFGNFAGRGPRSGSN
ncbi:MAG: pyridoxal-dependent decarboxylase [Pseudomonadota bacterium]